jgi:hypothetical protein
MGCVPLFDRLADRVEWPMDIYARATIAACLCLLGTPGLADPAQPALFLVERLLARSQDFTEHRAAFVKAAKELINDGRCTPRDFEKTGGWRKSAIKYRKEPVYFTYCGGMTISDRIYLNAETGRIFQD